MAISPLFPVGSHTAVVRMNLHVNGQMLQVAQMGPDFLILKEAVQLPPSKGVVTLEIDGKAQRFEVHFRQGISSNKKRVMVRPMNSC